MTTTSIMMKKKKRLLVLFLAAGLTWVLFNSRAGNPPNGRTNAPFDGYCTGCHSPNNSLDGTVTLSGIPETVMGGETYNATLTVEVTQGNAVSAGFQMVSVFGSNEENAGSFATNSSDEGINTAGDREYIEHRGAKNFSNNSASWTFDWVAPDGPDAAEIVMYFAGNITNGNSGQTGDRPKSGSMTFTLSASSVPLAASITSENEISCNGAGDGSATVEADGGTPPYSYSWSNGETTASISNLDAGSYEVTVSDAAMNSTTATATIDEPALLTVNISTTNETGMMGNDGTASAETAGGTGNKSYMWSNGESTSEITGLAPGSYEVTVTDENGCEVTGTATIESFACALALTSEVTHNSCFGEADGSASLQITGASDPVTYAWSNGSTDSSISDLPAGLYTVTVVDNGGCQSTLEITVEQPDSLTSTAALKPDVCGDQPQGSISVEINGGSAPYQYLWSNGMLSSSISNLPAGAYDLTITDENSCTDVLSFTVVMEDTTAPVFSGCPQNIMLDSAQQFTYENPVSSDNCGTIDTVIIDGPASGSVFPEGETTIIFTAIDETGNSSSCSFVVTVDQSTFVINDRFEGISIGPNPFVDQITLEDRGEPLHKTLELVTMEGQMIFQDRWLPSQQHFVIPGNDLPKGFYILRIRSETKSASVKMLKR